MNIQMRNIRNVSRVCLLLAINIFNVSATDDMGKSQPVVVYPGNGAQSAASNDKPVLVPFNPVCEPKYVNGKRVINNTSNPQECAMRAQEKARQDKQTALNAAVQAIKAVKNAPLKQEECIRTVSNASQECLRNKIKKNSQILPKYVVASKSNKVDIFEDGKKIFTGVRIQTHYKTQPKKPKPSKYLTEYPDVVVFNELGDVIATKTPKAKKVSNCICPVPGSTLVPETKEKILSGCIKQDCTSSGIMTSILSNSTVEPLGEADSSKPPHENKEKGSDEEKK